MLLEKRALWLRKEQARKKRAAEVQHLTPNFTTATKYSLTCYQIAARPISENARLIGEPPPPAANSNAALRARERQWYMRLLNASGAGQLWMSMIQRAAARELVKSIRGDARGDTPAGGRSALEAAQNISHR